MPGQPDPILAAINGASTVDDLQTIYRANRHQWQHEHTFAVLQRDAIRQDVDAIMRGLRVQVKASELSIVADARQLVDAANAGQITLPGTVSLAALLVEPDEPIAWRIDRLWPAGGNVMLVAQFKAGKSTMVGNALRSLVDGSRFLGQYETQPVGRVVLIDDELGAARLRRWLRDHNIANPERVDVIDLRGRAAAFNIITPQIRARWVDLIGQADALILDCLRPILDALGVDEDKDAGRFLDAWQALLTEAGVPDSMIVQHAGHGSERARGSSRLRDWPDAEWRLVRESDEPSSARYFTAYGRDVDEHEQRLRFEPSDRSLWVDGGSRRDARTDDAVGGVLAMLAGQPEPLSGRAITTALAGSHPRDTVRAALRKAIKAGQVLVEDGPRGAQLHYLNPSSTSSARSTDLDDLAA